ncbi:lysyl-tRNA synthetase-like protein [Mytilinidion resinicola]|uniref:Lysyl-tRNA synthetase n=1 Tax=Mytilinidion resinicola TaxID=574789 RepID=A0A6A6YJZ9_9PEZI|nr:lysyl-tRNA synthetase-like protein [Mytilinidion resinicola]KAF2808247.1 lysyl-tRNA synthetase-like protein [Mytilinidion resinicola]
MSRNACRFLRPYLSRNVKPISNPDHTRICCAIQRRFAHDASEVTYSPSSSHDAEKRLAELKKAGDLKGYHPRLTDHSAAQRHSVATFLAKYEGIEAGDKLLNESVEMFGRVRSRRTAGNKLVFLDIERQTGKFQGMCDFGVLSEHGVSLEDFKQFKKIVRKGDWFSITGYPKRTSSGELSLVATELPKSLAPSLHSIPETLEDFETLSRHPHVRQLVNRQSGDIFRLRSRIYQLLRTFLTDRDFIEVETPMFDVGAGGAIARPFETVATEMMGTTLRLRIAPELSLKRLVIAGNEKVFEMGRVFRNEGVDTTHNPEFTICEFYEVGATLEDLILRTETLFREISSMIQTHQASEFPSTTPPTIDFSGPFNRLPFIPTIEAAIGQPLTDLSSPDATSAILSLYETLSLPVPTNPTLPRLLDDLAEHYIEPLCATPTFITHHPEALSPLSKSFLDPVTNQRVAARVELFIKGREYVNAYEEENSPFEQRRKFEQQLGFQPAKADAGVCVDESYIEALEWGMPPTGGWGCGVDRLVMLFGGKKRIADVLPFGTLRNVVAIARNGKDR